MADEEALKQEITAAEETVQSSAAKTVSSGEVDSDEPEFLQNVIYVGVRMRLDQISEISTVDQSYTVHGLLELDWLASEEEKQRDAASSSANPYKPDPPCFWPAFQNTVEFSTIKEDWEISDDKWNVHSIWFKGKFTESFEVQNFPFDVQDMTFVFFVENYMKRVILVPYREQGQTFQLNRTYLSIQDWDIVHNDANFRAIDWGMARTGKPSAPWMEVPGDYASTVFFRVQARRKSYAFSVRILFWMFMLSLITFGQAGMDATDIEGRLAYSIGLVFAVVAFQIIIGDSLPSVPYLTLVDRYNILVFLLIIGCMFEALIVGWKEDGLVADAFDWWFYAILFPLYVVFHIGGVIYIKRKIVEEDEKIGDTLESTQDIQPSFMNVSSEQATANYVIPHHKWE
mmetsp:Transcript_9419/g.14433  ORF Transcript_9419/g.14433 Transcript_9419/m.14433 type:complete len:400 (+) Transcript_9419:56-1255(+)